MLTYGTRNGSEPSPAAVKPRGRDHAPKPPVSAIALSRACYFSSSPSHEPRATSQEPRAKSQRRQPRILRPRFLQVSKPPAPRPAPASSPARSGFPGPSISTLVLVLTAGTRPPAVSSAQSQVTRLSTVRCPPHPRAPQTLILPWLSQGTCDPGRGSTLCTVNPRSLMDMGGRESVCVCAESHGTARRKASARRNVRPPASHRDQPASARDE